MQSCNQDDDDILSGIYDVARRINVNDHWMAYDTLNYVQHHEYDNMILGKNCVKTKERNEHEC